MRIRIYFLIIMTILSFTAQSQYGSFGVTDARSLGMGNTYNATTFDLYTIGKNPGLLAKKDGTYKVSVIFPNLTAQQYGIGDVLNNFEYYTSNKLRSDGLVTIDEEKFKVAIDNNGLMFLDMLLGFFSAAYHPNERIGSFAFSMSDYVTGYMKLPDVILDVNYGQEMPDGSFTLDDFAFKAWWIRSYAVSYSRYIYKDENIYRSEPGLIKNISVGLTAKLSNTYAYTDIGVSAEAYYSNATHSLSGSYQAHAIYSFSEDLTIADAFHVGGDDRPPPGFMRLKPAGKGYGFDIGAGAELRKGWTLGLALTDIGSIKWTGVAGTSDFEGYIDVSGVIDYETIDSIKTGLSLTKERKENFTTPMPTALRLGVALNFEEMFQRFPGELLVGFDYNQGLNNQPSNFKASRFSLGFEYRYKPNWPILIGGYTYDLLDIGRGAIGLGYKTWFMDIYVSTIDIFSMVSGGPRFSASLVARWKIFSGVGKQRAPECFN